MWILSDLESSIEALQMSVGQLIEVPTIYYSSLKSGIPEIASEFDAVIKRQIIKDREVWIAELGGSSTTIVGDQSLQISGPTKLHGYLYWDPYWYVEYPTEPRLCGIVQALGIIVREGPSYCVFVTDPSEKTFQELQNRVLKRGLRIEYRCLMVKPNAGDQEEP